MALVFAPSASAAPPAIALTTISGVTTDSVLLEAEINPEGKAVNYRFEYGPADCEANPCTSVPSPEGKLPVGSTPVRISVPVGGLTPGATYHFRAIAKSNGVGGGEAKSGDRVFATYQLEHVFGPCPNDAFRLNQPSAALPDCRAYEQASPVEKNGLDASGSYLTAKSSPDGEAVTFDTSSGIPDSSGTQESPLHISRRGTSDWSTEGLLPPQSYGQQAGVIGWTPDFSQVFDLVRRLAEPETSALLSLSPGGSLSEVVPYFPFKALGSFIPNFLGASADGSKVFFESARDPLTPEAAPGKNNLYVWDRDTGDITLVGVLPDSACGSPPCVPPAGSMGGSYDWVNGSSPVIPGGAAEKYYTQEQHAISADGKSAYFTAAATGQLYRRTDPAGPDAETVRVSATEKTNGGGEDGADVNGTRPAAFMAATPEGSEAFFTSSEKLTDDATTGPEPSEPSAIARAKLSDGSEKKMDFLPASAYGVAIGGEFIYWADPKADSIGRARLEGGAVVEPKPDFIEVPEIEVESGKFAPANPQYVAVNGEHIYWTNAPSETTAGERKGTVGWAALNGAEVNAELITGASNPRGIAVDDNFVYWANDCPGEEGSPRPECHSPLRDELRAIGRADLEGTPASVEPTFIEVGSEGTEWDPQGIAVNATHIYVAENGNQFVRQIARYDLDGSPASLKRYFLFAGPNLPGLRGIAIDDDDLYWSDQGHDTVGRIELALFDGGYAAPGLNGPEAFYGDGEPEWIKDAHGPKGLAIDGEHIYWAANQEVLPNAGRDLYRWDAQADQQGHHLTDLAVDNGDENGAEVRGVLGASEDGSYLYFVANGVPDGVSGSPNPEGESAAPGSCSEILQANSPPGACNLYLWHAGQIGFIARLAEADNANWSGTVAGVEVATTHYQKPARVSPDGRTLLFRSTRRLTAYDNEGKPELYRYRVGEPGLLCVSCNPTGEPPSKARVYNIELAILSIEIPASTLSRSLSEDGNRVFFESTDKLVAADANGEGGCPTVGSQFQLYSACQDVYEWEAKGTGSCESEEQNGGCLYLISSGKSNQSSFFADASADGDDALIFTASGLVGQDRDRLVDVYDARVGGGLASQDEAPPLPCEAEGCKAGASEAPAFNSPASSGFAGPPNPIARKPKTRCPKGTRKARAKGKSRCLAKKHERHRKDAKPSGRAGR